MASNNGGLSNGKKYLSPKASKKGVVENQDRWEEQKTKSNMVGSHSNIIM